MCATWSQPRCHIWPFNKHLKKWQYLAEAAQVGTFLQYKISTTSDMFSDENDTILISKEYCKMWHDIHHCTFSFTVAKSELDTILLFCNELEYNQEHLNRSSFGIVELDQPGNTCPWNSQKWTLPYDPESHMPLVSLMPTIPFSVLYMIMHCTFYFKEWYLDEMLMQFAFFWVLRICDPLQRSANAVLLSDSGAW